MILTKNAIKRAWEKGDIVLSPFDESQLGPVSYDYRLGPTLLEFTDFDGEKCNFKKVTIPKNGYVLKPHIMYLGNSFETLGSTRYAMSLIGNSSMGRLGLFMQVSADLGHTESSHKWTLEIVASRPTRVYPKMVVGQVSFWRNQGEVIADALTYNQFNEPHASLYVDRKDTP
tara:strand:- start:178 stop:693 length:516 start_codon:yes stop_codon:yes gene_type:complete